MYKKGDLKLTDPVCETTDEDGFCDDYGEHTHVVSDARDDNHHKDVAYLPHSCDEWVVGGIAEMEDMVADLLFAITVLKARFQSSL